LRILKCLLFDLDGLLVDSEPLQFRSYQHALKQFGFSLNLDTWIEWHRVEASTTRWIRDQGLDLDAEKVRAVKKVHYERLVADELELKSGVKKLIESSSEEFELGVVSSSRLESIEGCLRKFNLHSYFSTFVSGADLERSKPYPDPYLEALKLMNLAPGSTLALEDSVTGFRAATAAGLSCVVCPDHFIPKPDDAFVAAALVVESLSELNPERLRATHAKHNEPSARD
jgi:HAD superfamily hydrolase (TIGR01509 family)